MCKVIEEAGFHVETDFPDFGDSTRHFVNYWEHGVASEEWHMNKIYNAVLKGIKKGWDIQNFKGKEAECIRRLAKCFSAGITDVNEAMYLIETYTRPSFLHDHLMKRKKENTKASRHR